MHDTCWSTPRTLGAEVVHDDAVYFIIRVSQMVGLPEKTSSWETRGRTSQFEFPYAEHVKTRNQHAFSLVKEHVNSMDPPL